MATFKWIGGSADWNTPTSWDVGSVPGGTDSAFIAVTGGNYVVTVGTADTVGVGGLTLNAGNATLEIDGALTAHGILTISAGTILTRGNLTASVISDGGLLGYVGSHVLGNVTLYLDNAAGGTLQVQDVDGKTPATLTLGPTAVIQQTTASATISSTAMNGETIINQGHINALAANGSLTIAPLNFTNVGTISAFNGDTLTIGGNWDSSAGTITVSSGATLDLAGAFTTAGIGTIIGATSINLSGTLNNAAASLAVGNGSPLGTVNLQGTGVISGGTIVDVGGNGFTFTGNSTFNAVTYEGALDIATLGGKLTITNGLTVTPAISAAPGFINLTGGGDAILNFVNSQTIDNATINLDGTNSPSPLTEIDIGGATGSVLTLGPNLTVSSTVAFNLATIANTNGQHQTPVVNKGTIVAAATGGRFSIARMNGFTNQGVIAISNGDSFSVQPGSGLFNNTASGSVSVGSGSTLQILDGAATSPISNAGTITLASGATLDLEGFFPLLSLGNLANQGAITQIGGTLDGQNSTIDLGPGTMLGSVILSGNIRNATIGTNGALTIQSTSASLLNDTVRGAINLTSSLTKLTIDEGVTVTDSTGKLAGTVNVIGKSDALVFGNLLTGSAAGRIVDNVTINVGNALGAATIAPGFSGGTFTVGANASIVSATPGALASLSPAPGTSVILDGTLSATGKGGLFTIPIVSGFSFINNGTMIVGNGDTLSVAAMISAGSGPGTIDIGTGGIADFHSAVAADQTLAFTGTSGILGLLLPTGFAGTIGGYIIGDTIDLIDIVAKTAVWTAGTAGQPGTLTISNAGGTTVAAMSMLGDYSTASFTVVSDSAGGSDVTTNATATCYAAGTRILTVRGEVAVEHLREGDVVITVSGGTQPIRWIGRRHVDFRRHPKPRRVLPMRIMANAFGEGRPRRDLLLSPDHAVFVDNMLIPIRHLENATTVVQLAVDVISYYHIELPRHDVVLAEGMPAESYLEAGARDAFANGDGLMQLHPDFTPPPDRFAMLWESSGYAPLVVAGEALARARWNLACQAMMLDTARHHRKRRAA